MTRCSNCGAEVLTVFRQVFRPRRRGPEVVVRLLCTDCANERRWRNVRQS